MTKYAVVNNIKLHIRKMESISIEELGNAWSFQNIPVSKVNLEHKPKSAYQLTNINRHL